MSLAITFTTTVVSEWIAILMRILSVAEGLFGEMLFYFFEFNSSYDIIGLTIVCVRARQFSYCDRVRRPSVNTIQAIQQATSNECSMNGMNGNIRAKNSRQTCSVTILILI